MFLAEQEGIGDKISNNLYAITPQLLSIILTFVVISTFCIIYNVKIRNHKEGQKMSGFLVLTEMFITSMEELVVSVMGKRYRKLTPYAMYIMMYILISCLLSLIGIESLASSFSVTLAMGLVTFIGIYYFGLRYQKLAYFKKFINPLELLTQFVPLISISFRLFGNLLGGSILVGMMYGMFIGVEAGFGGGSSAEIWNISGGNTPNAQFAYWWSGFNFMTIAIMPWLHLYFDLFDGGIQSIVFTMLTLSYWAEAMGEEAVEGKLPNKPSKKIKNNKRENKKQNANVLV